MIEIKFQSVCRNCSISDGIDHIYFYDGVDQKDFKDKTAFEVSLIVENWHKEDNLYCENCGKVNFDYVRIRIGNFELSNPDDLTSSCFSGQKELLIISIGKSSYRLKFEVGGNSKLSFDAFNNIYQCMWKHLNSRPNDDFSDKADGNFLISISFGENFKTNKYEARIENYNILGLTREEVVDCIEESTDYDNFKFNPWK